MGWAVGRLLIYRSLILQLQFLEDDFVFDLIKLSFHLIGSLTSPSRPDFLVSCLRSHAGSLTTRSRRPTSPALCRWLDRVSPFLLFDWFLAVALMFVKKTGLS